MVLSSSSSAFLHSRLRVAQVLAETEAEGPGKRFAVWVQGCPMRCPGCCNPHMLRTDGGELTTVDTLLRGVRESVAERGIEGVSLLGGEPFAQAASVAAFARAVQAENLSVMVFTGFTLEELDGRRSAEPAIGELLDATDLLVDGQYLRESPERERRWIGSSNQVMHFLTSRFSPDDPRMRQGNTVEIRLRRTPPGAVGEESTREIVVNGWPALAASLTGGLGGWRRR
jgi:anaerobic ribonucleoside-triphosphate reductase activating protein